MDKRERQKLILEILSNPDKHVRSQNELVILLRSKGVDVTQSTVNRDLKELRIHKEGDYYSIDDPRRVQLKREELSDLINTCVPDAKSLIENPKFVFIKTKAGYSQLLAQKLKEVFTETILGTVSTGEGLIIIYKGEKFLGRLSHFFDSKGGS